MQIHEHGTHNNPVLKIVFGIFFIVFPIIGFALGMQYQALVDKNNVIPTTIITPLVNKTSPIPNKQIHGKIKPDYSASDEAKNTNPNLKTYTSKTLGISFSYLQKQDSQTVTIKENGNKICVETNNSVNDNKCSGQSVEVFQKGKDESLEDAIKRLFLTGKDPQKCFVKISEAKNYSSNFVAGSINYPQGEDPFSEKTMANFEYCSRDYAQTNGIRYFLEDKNHPTKFLFFNIGQYAISSEGNKAWQDTVVIN